MHMLDARDERIYSGNLLDSMHAFILYFVVSYEENGEDIAIILIIKKNILTQSRFRACFKVDSVPLTNTCIRLTEYLRG